MRVYFGFPPTPHLKYFRKPRIVIGYNGYVIIPNESKLTHVDVTQSYPTSLSPELILNESSNLKLMNGFSLLPPYDHFWKWFLNPSHH